MYRESSNCREELEFHHQTRCIRPLFKACRGKISELLTGTDNELVGLCQLRIEAIAKDDWERSDVIKQIELPHFTKRRNLLEECLDLAASFGIFMQED